MDGFGVGSVGGSVSGCSCCEGFLFLYVLGSSHWNPGGGSGNGDLCVCPYAVMMPSSFRLGKHAAPGVDMETTSTVGHLNQIAATFL